MVIRSILVVFGGTCGVWCPSYMQNSHTLAGSMNITEYYCKHNSCPFQILPWKSFTGMIVGLIKSWRFHGLYPFSIDCSYQCSNPFNLCAFFLMTMSSLNVNHHNSHNKLSFIGPDTDCLRRKWKISCWITKIVLTV